MLLVRRKLYWINRCLGEKLRCVFLCLMSVYVVKNVLCGRRGMWRGYEDCGPWSTVCEVCGRCAGE